MIFNGRKILWKLRRMFVFLLFLLILSFACANASHAQMPEDFESKALILVFNINDGTLSHKSSKIVYGEAPDNFGDFNDFSFKASDNSGNVLSEAGIEDPRNFRILDLSGNPEDSNYLFKDNVDFEVIIPYEENTDKVNVYDNQGNLLVEKDIEQAVLDFCAENPNDASCSEMEIQALFVFISVIIALIVFLYLIISPKSKNRRS